MDENVRPTSLQYLALYAAVIGCVTLWPFDFFAANRVMHVRGIGLRFEPYGTIYSDTLTNQDASPQEFTLVARLVVATPVNPAYEVIASQGVSHTKVMMALAQAGAAVVFTMRGMQRPLMADSVLVASGEVTIVIKKSGSTIAMFVNGVQKDSASHPLMMEAGALAGPLVFGAAPDGHFPWRGTLISFGVFGRLLHVSEIDFGEHLEADPSMLFWLNASTDSLVAVDGRHLGSTQLLCFQKTYAPFKRMILESPVEYFRRSRLYLSDSLLNILLFVPLGIVLSAHLRGFGRGYAVSLVLVTLTGFAISCGVEIGQAFLPSRHSSWVDVLANTFGTLVGAILLTLAHRSRSRPAKRLLKLFCGRDLGENNYDR